jgi:hypothetical protein
MPECRCDQRDKERIWLSLNLKEASNPERVESVICSWSQKPKYKERLGVKKIRFPRPGQPLMIKFDSHELAFAFKLSGIYQLDKVDGIDINQIKWGWWLKKRKKPQKNIE